MNIVPKFQGGGFSSLFTQYTPVEVQSSQPQQPRQQATPAKEKDDSLSQKDMLDMISKIDGLPNDMQVIASNLKDMFQMTQYTGTRNLADAFISNIYQLKVAAFNKKEYEDSKNLVTKNGGLEEIPITTNGRIIALNNDGVPEEVSVGDYIKYKNTKYTPITNANLLYLRSHSPQYANRNTILEVVNNGIGMDKVHQLISERLKGLGTSTASRSGYSVRTDKYIQQGLEILNEMDSKDVINSSGMTLEGLYQNRSFTQTQIKQAEAALYYIYNSLPLNARTLLQVQSGNSENPTQGALNLIYNYIVSGQSERQDYSVTYIDDDGSGNGKGGGGGNGDDGKVKSSAYYNMVRGIGGNDISVKINKGSKYELTSRGVTYGAVPDIDGKPISATSLTSMLQQGVQGIVTNTSGITFGDRQLTQLDMTDIAYDGSSGVVAMLPTKMNSFGVKVVDIGVLDRWEEACENLRQQGININNEEHREKYADEISKELFDKDLKGLLDYNTGKLDMDRMGVFLMVNGYAVGKDDTKFKSDYTYEIQDPDDQLVSYVREMLSTNSDRDNYEMDFNGLWWNDDHLYQGTIYIPITSNQLQAVTAAGQNIYERDAQRKESEWQAWQKRRTAQSPDIGILQIQ